MKRLTNLAPRLIAGLLLCMSLSACFATNNEALYYSPSSAGHHVYGYQPVDFSTLNAR